jgi:hypothetical protein
LTGFGWIGREYVKEYLTGAWHGLPQQSRTMILVTLVAVVGTGVALALAWNYDWRPLVNLLAELGG